ncbi:helix-turn-helix transcriptional regulator [Nonomuraea guangzhouensis]|uniref:Response regulator transcription factor n=1 Tax=Nonomuraea guangzhouensis TaxID=1291555 RepID=A0ABW4GEH0_9ACTN|nr:LuxR C-terminal-related transcriptional regulator [Nonomuraea guangzhouensis]
MHHDSGSVTARVRAVGDSPEQSDEHIAALLGGIVDTDTLRLLWDASQGDRTLAGELVRIGRGLGVLVCREGVWHWTPTPNSPAVQLAELIEARAEGLESPQLDALEKLTGPLTEPHAAIARVRRERAAQARLTPREQDVLRLLCEGLSPTAIARRLGLSPRTVTKHQERLYRKLGISDRVNAVLLAQRFGLVPEPP